MERRSSGVVTKDYRCLENPETAMMEGDPKLYFFKVLANMTVYLKWSYDVAKKNIIWCIGGSRLKKTHYFPHTVHHCCSSMLCLSETCRFLQSYSF